MYGIDLSGFRVIYDGKVLNAVALREYYGKDECFDTESGDRKEPIVYLDTITILAINSDGILIEIMDEAWRFQFVPRAEAKR